MRFEEKLMKLRKMNGFSQEDLGNKINVSRQIVSKWELGQSKPNMNNLMQISKLFNINLEDLTNDDVEINSKYSSESKLRNKEIDTENKINFDSERLGKDNTYENEKQTSNEFDNSKSSSDEEFNQRKYGNYNNQSGAKKSKLGIVILIIFFILIAVIVWRLVIAFSNEKEVNQGKQQSSENLINQENHEPIENLNKKYEDDTNGIKTDVGEEKKKNEDSDSNNKISSNQITTNNQESFNNGNNMNNQNTTNNQSVNSGISQIEIMQFNGVIEMNKGTKDKFFITGLLDEIISSNQKNPNRIILLEYNEIITSDAEEIRNIKYNLNAKKYEVILEYDDDGFINKVILRKI